MGLALLKGWYEHYGLISQKNIAHKITVRLAQGIREDGGHRGSSQVQAVEWSLKGSEQQSQILNFLPHVSDHTFHFTANLTQYVYGRKYQLGGD